MGCGAGSIPSGRGIFDQCMGSVPIQLRDNFGWLLISSSTFGLEKRQRLRRKMCLLHVTHWLDDCSYFSADKWT